MKATIQRFSIVLLVFCVAILMGGIYQKSRWITSEYFINHTLKPNDQLIANKFKNIWTKSNYRDAIGLLQHLDRITTRNKVQYFIAFGTLLGQQRHGDIIPWDDDLDVGMLHDDFLAIYDQVSTPEIVLIQNKNKDVFKLCYRNKPLIGKYPWSWPFLDIFMFFPTSNNKLYCKDCNTRQRVAVDRSYFYPLVRQPFGQASFWIPRHSTSLLNIWYGNDWRDTCDSGGWCHQTETTRHRPLVAPCSQVMKLIKPITSK